jgi:CxxC-x17-CxxC domain-containing protein
MMELRLGVESSFFTFCLISDILFGFKVLDCLPQNELPRRAAAPVHPSLNSRVREECSMFADRDVLCVSCGATFVFSTGEQQFFQEKGFTNIPKRCKQCKAKRQSGTGLRRIETHVTCSQCGIDTTVPFKPTQGKPVLCRTCFSSKPKAPEIAAA